MDKRSKWQVKIQTDSSKDRITLGKGVCKYLPGRENRTKGRDLQQNNGARRLMR